MVLNAVASIVLTPILLWAMGVDNYGTYMAFAAVLSVASAGEAGLGGAVGINTNRLLADSASSRFQRLHETARTAFVLITCLTAVVFVMVGLLFHGDIGFAQTPKTGPIWLLFCLGGINVVTSTMISYLSNSAYGAGTVMWSIVPLFVLSLSCTILQIGVASVADALWLIHLPSVACALLGVFVWYLIYRNSNYQFGPPIRFGWHTSERGLLFSSALFSSMFGLANLIYTATDRIVINWAFGAKAVPAYQLNYKLVELSLSLTIMAGMVSLPKIVSGMLSKESSESARAAKSSRTLASYQGILGLTAATGYIVFNDTFIRLWVGHEMNASTWIQVAFAMYLILVSSGDIFVQLCGRLSEPGLRFAGVVVLAGGFLNLGLSVFAAYSLRWLPGVAFSTCIAQFLVCATILWRVQTVMGINYTREGVKVLLIPLGIVLCIAVLKASMGAFSTVGIVLQAIAGLVMIVGYAKLIGVDRESVILEIVGMWHAFRSK